MNWPLEQVHRSRRWSRNLLLYHFAQFKKVSGTFRFPFCWCLLVANIIKEVATIINEVAVITKEAEAYPSFRIGSLQKNHKYFTVKVDTELQYVIYWEDKRVSTNEQYVEPSKHIVSIGNQEKYMKNAFLVPSKLIEMCIK